MSLIAKENRLFVIDLEYTVPFDQIEPVLAPHMDFVAQAYQQGHFLLSGPKDPRTGGIVVAQAPNLETLQALLAQDPFVSENLVKVTISSFQPSNRAPALRDVLLGARA